MTTPLQTVAPRRMSTKESFRAHRRAGGSLSYYAFLQIPPHSTPQSGTTTATPLLSAWAGGSALPPSCPGISGSPSYQLPRPAAPSPSTRLYGPAPATSPLSQMLGWPLRLWSWLIRSSGQTGQPGLLSRITRSTVDTLCSAFRARRTAGKTNLVPSPHPAPDRAPRKP